MAEAGTVRMLAKSVVDCTNRAVTEPYAAQGSGSHPTTVVVPTLYHMRRKVQMRAVRPEVSRTFDLLADPLYNGAEATGWVC